LPCTGCAKRLINLGNVKRVYYGHEYRSRDSAELFRQVGIELIPVEVASSGIQLRRES
jgi:deoxycytidylate deaminase